MSVIIWKRNMRPQEKEKEDQEAREGDTQTNTKVMKTSTPEKPRGSLSERNLGLKRESERYLLKGQRQKGRKVKATKKGKMEGKKQHQNVLSKGSARTNKQNITNMVLWKWKGRENQKRKTKSKWRILKEPVPGESNSKKIIENHVAAI